ncbi:MAG TPA: ester cyclase, partial [Duganella sp.]|nr:ester cyclase [Duganella sp.]
TLPPGREQGPGGPLQASKAFRVAVPDLKAEATHLVAQGDRVSVRLHFTGHFTGKFGDGDSPIQGKGQAIDFQAFDIYRVANGRIAENWHLEDNLTLLRQLGVLPGG